MSMLIAYQYKLNPSPNQCVELNQHIEMLRLQYNFRVRERTEAYRQASEPVLGNYCDLRTDAECCPLTCSVSKNALYGNPWTKPDKKTGKVKKRSAKAQQDADLVNLKQQRPWYKRIQHHVLQQMIARVDAAFKRFFQGLGKYPKPKRRGKFRSFCYPPPDVRFSGNKVRLPGIGWMRFYQSRPFPAGFELRTVTVKRRADGFYLVVQLRDDTVPELPVPNEIKTAIGVDLGIKKLASLSNGEVIANPQFYKQVQRRRARLHRAASRKKRGSKNRRQAYQRLAKFEQTVASRREDYHWKQANYLVSLGDLIVFEDLNTKGMMGRCKPKTDPQTGKYLHNGQAAKSGLNKAIADAAWGGFQQKVRVKAERWGKLVIEINPKYSSQECSQCGYVSPTNRNCEKFLCENCGHYADADLDAAVVIRERGLQVMGIELPVPGDLREVTPTLNKGADISAEVHCKMKSSSGLPDESGKPKLVEKEGV
ncbi:MAG: RNA-guided endonuclease InsQ/TnpB family protein [Xenococcaceae cyanobacterium]